MCQRIIIKKVERSNLKIDPSLERITVLAMKHRPFLNITLKRTKSAVQFEIPSVYENEDGDLLVFANFLCLISNVQDNTDDEILVLVYQKKPSNVKDVATSYLFYILQVSLSRDYAVYFAKLVFELNTKITIKLIGHESTASLSGLSRILNLSLQTVKTLLKKVKGGL